MLVTLLIFTFFGCSSEPPPRPRPVSRPPVVQEIKPTEAPMAPEVKAPWEVQDFRDQELQKLLSEKKVREALTYLSEKKKTTPNLEVYTEEASLLLKLGHAQDALTDISEFVNYNQIGMDDVPPQLALIAAYAYKSQKDIDQMFAWFGVALRSTTSPRVYAVAKQEVKNLLSRISDKIFADYLIKWERDQSLSPLILEEQNRRREGGAVVRLEEIDYFSPVTYGYSSQELPKPVTALVDEKTSGIAIVLPPKSTRAIEDQKKSLELALSTATPPQSYQVISNQSEQPATPPKVIINLAAKELSPSPVTHGSIILSVNPRLENTSTSIAPTLNTEIQELIKISTEVYKCDQTFIIADNSISSPPTLMRVTVDELLDIASTRKEIIVPCLIGGFEVEDQIEKLTRIKARWPGLRLFGRSTWLDPVLLQTYQGLFEGSVFITPFFSGSSRELVREFLTSFQNMVGTEGTYSDALAYDAARISALILAHKQSEGTSYTLQSLTGIEAFVVVIDKTNLSGRINVSERRFTRLTLKNGDLEELGSY